MEKDGRSVDIHYEWSHLKLVCILMFGILLVFFTGLRPPGFDPDYYNYLKTLNYSPSNFNFTKIEPFYWLLVYFNQLLFGASKYSFFLIFAFLFVYLSLKAINKFSINPLFSILLYLFLIYPHFGLIQIRNGVALAIALFAVHDLLDNRKDKFYIKIVFASLWHYSLIAFLILAFFNKKKFNYFWLLVPIIAYLFSFVLTLDNVYNISSYAPHFIKWKVQTYIYIIRHEDIFNVINLYNLKSVTIILVFYLSSFMVSKSKYPDKYKIIFYTKIIGFSIALWFMFKNIPIFSFRLSNNFMVFVIFLIPLLVSKFVKNERWLLKTLFLVTFLILSYNQYVRHEIFDWSILK